MGDFKALLDRWSAFFEVMPIPIPDADDIDIDDLKHLIFDTYHFYRKELADTQTVRRQELRLYKYISQMSLFFISDSVVDNAENATIADCLAGLCYVVEEGFDAGYGDKAMPLGLIRNTTAGGAEPEADMTTYESFEKSFDDNVRMLQEEYEME